MGEEIYRWVLRFVKQTLIPSSPTAEASSRVIQPALWAVSPVWGGWGAGVYWGSLAEQTVQTPF